MLGQPLHNIVVATEAFASSGVKNMVCISAETVKQSPKKPLGLHLGSHMNKNKKKLLSKFFSSAISWLPF